MARTRTTRSKASKPAAGRAASPGMRRQADGKGLLLFSFFLSGVSALGYQVVWARLLAGGIGHEMPAVLAIVTAFMAGMGIGAFLYRRIFRHVRNDARVYALLEFSIGGWALLSAFLIPAMTEFVLQIVPVNTGPVRYYLIVFAAVTIALLPATAAMGATLPAIQNAFALLRNTGSVGLLYGMNTAGAVIGCLGAAFLIMRVFGLSRSVFLLASLNIVSGVVAWWALRKGATERPAEPVAERPERPPDIRLLLTLLGTGFLAIGFEVTVIRVLSHVLENTIYTFAVVLAVHLLGIAAGSAAWQRSSRLRQLGISQLIPLLAGAALLSGLLAYCIPVVYPWARGMFGDSPAGVALSELLGAAILFAIPSILMGMTFATLAQQSFHDRGELAWALQWNTIGAAMAPIVFGTLLLPSLGLKGTLWIIPVVYVLLIQRVRWQLIFLPALALAGYFLPGTGDLIEAQAGSKIISLKEGVMGSVAVLEGTNGHRILKVNNRFQMGGTAAAIAQQRHADIPLLLHGEPESALFLGLGTGITAATATNYPSLRVDGVELVPEVIESIPLFTGQPLAESTIQVHAADARRYVASTTNSYDVIVADLFHPAQDGAGFLYTREHFTAIRKRLTPDGLFCQWLPLYQLDTPALRSIVQTFLEVFPEADSWLLRNNVHTPVLGLTGYGGAPQFKTNNVESRLDYEPLAKHLRVVALADSLRLYGTFLGGASELGAFARGGELNTDDHPILIFQAPAFTYKRTVPPFSTLLVVLEEFRSKPNSLGLPNAFAGQVQAYIEARDTYLMGLVLKARNEIPQAIAHYLESARISPEFTSGYAQCLTIAAALSASNPEGARELLEQLAAAQPHRGAAAEMLERLEVRSGGTAQ